MGSLPFADAQDSASPRLRRLAAEVPLPDPSAAFDPELRLARCGGAFYADRFELRPTSARRVRSNSVTPIAPLDQTFELDSRPTATTTIWLDFDGAQLQGTLYNDAYGEPILDNAPYSDDTDPTFSSEELAEIQNIWQAVAETYVTMDVNITTAPQSDADLVREDATDHNYGTHVVITDTPTRCGCAGLASLGGLDLVGTESRRQNVAFVFTHEFGLDPGRKVKATADAASHEAGHTFGLDHDVVAKAGGGTDYYGGQGVWAPIMGRSYSRPVVQWSRGEYAGASNFEDDLAIIHRNAPLIADDVPDTPQSAGVEVIHMTGDDDTTTRRAVIGDSSDVDAFAIDVTAAGVLKIDAEPAAPARALDLRVRLIDSTGAVLVDEHTEDALFDYDTAFGLGSLISFSVDPGRYFVLVSGSGDADPATTGYSNYASIGTYDIAVSQSVYPPALQGDLGNGAVGVSYRDSLKVLGSGPFTWKRVSGTLPRGLSLKVSGSQRQKLILAGTPTKSGTYTFRVQATDAYGGSAERHESLTIRR